MHHRTLILTAVITLCAGCGSLIPKEQQKSQSVASAEALAVEQEKTIRRVMEVGPQAAAIYQRPVTVKPGLAGPKDEYVTVVPLGQPVREDLTYTTTTKTGAGSSAKADGSSITSIPLGVKLGLIGLGIAAITASLLFAWKSIRGTGVGHGIALADEVIANQIRAKRAAMARSTDQSEITRIATEVAEAEAERGRLNARKK